MDSNLVLSGSFALFAMLMLYVSVTWPDRETKLSSSIASAIALLMAALNTIMSLIYLWGIV